MSAEAFGAGVSLAKIRFEQASTQNCQSFARCNTVGGSRERITSTGSASARHQLALTQDTHKLRDVLGRYPLRSADLRDRETRALPLRTKPQQTAKSIFFLCAQFHKSASRIEDLCLSFIASEHSELELCRLGHLVHAPRWLPNQFDFDRGDSGYLA